MPQLDMGPTRLTPLDAEIRAQAQRWLALWQQQGRSLEEQRTTELRKLDDESAARIAVELVWRLGTLGDHRGGDDGVGLVSIKQALDMVGRRR